MRAGMLAKRMGRGDRRMTGLNGFVRMGDVVSNDDVDVTGVGWGCLLLDSQLVHGSLQKIPRPSHANGLGGSCGYRSTAKRDAVSQTPPQGLLPFGRTPNVVYRLK